MGTVVSAPTTVSTILAPVGWWLKDPRASTMNRPVSVRDGWAPTRTRKAGVFEVEGPAPVIAAGRLSSVRSPLTLRTLAAGDHAPVMAMLTSGRTLLLQDLHGHGWYLQIVGDLSERLVRALPSQDEPWPVRHLYEVATSVVEVGRP